MLKKVKFNLFFVLVSKKNRKGLLKKATPKQPRFFFFSNFYKNPTFKKFLNKLIDLTECSFITLLTIIFSLK